MNTMQTAPAARQPRALLSSGARFAVAVAVTLALAAAWVATEHESHEAVVLSTAALTTHPIYVTLEPVEIVAHRLPAVDAAQTAVAASAHGAAHAL